jgi:hypothetical protein
MTSSIGYNENNLEARVIIISSPVVVIAGI